MFFLILDAPFDVERVSLAAKRCIRSHRAPVTEEFHILTVNVRCNNVYLFLTKRKKGKDALALCNILIV